jgi:hypothetical protein
MQHTRSNAGLRHRHQGKYGEHVRKETELLNELIAASTIDRKQGCQTVIEMLAKASSGEARVHNTTLECHTSNLFNFPTNIQLQ